MIRFLLVILSFFLSGEAVLSQSFENQASSLGVDYCFGSVSHFAGGISTVDFNKDGFDDLSLATHYGEYPKFFTGNGSGFTPVSWSIPDISVHSTVIWVDYDNDEDYDLYITGYEYQNRLYQNDGSFIFTDVTTSAGFPSDEMPTTGSVWGDIDHDGYLDVYVYNYSEENTNYFYRNQGDGTFEDETNTWNVGNGNLLTLAAAFFDYDGDSNIDLFVANDARIPSMRNAIYWNDNLEACIDKISSSGMDVPIFSMNAGIGDFDRDGDFDIYVTNSEPDKAYLWQKSIGGAFFINQAENYEVGYNGSSWGGNFFDYDNDMDLDLYVCNGERGEEYQNALFENSMPNPYFLELSGDGREIDTVSSWCNAIMDFDNDGKCDIVVSSACPDDYFIWKNTTNNSNNYIKIKLEGSVSNADAVGSIIEVISGGISQFKFTQCGEAFQAQNSYNHHFGLADEDIVDTIRVTFPSGIVGYVYDTSVNIVVTVDEEDFVLAHTNLLLEGINGNLHWSWTGTEIPDHYVLERKEGLDPFKQIMTLGFKDKGIIEIPAFSPRTENTIYRLKAIKNGLVRIYSNALSIANDLHSWTTYPSIVRQNQEFHLKWLSDMEGELIFEIVDGEGNVLKHKPLRTHKGANSHTIEGNLPSGLYYMRLISESKRTYILSKVVVI